MSFDTILTFIFASSILALVPGPDNIFVLTQSALHGKRAGLFITLGLCSGLIIHTLAVSLGLTAIFMMSATAFNILKFLGAAYLLYLAWQAFKASASELNTQKSAALSAAALYRRGIIMNLSNPKVGIFFLAFLPQFTQPDAGAISLQLMLLGGIFIVVALLIFSLLATLSGLISHQLKRSNKTQIIMSRIAGLIFVGLALKLAGSPR